MEGGIPQSFADYFGFFWIVFERKCQSTPCTGGTQTSFAVAANARSQATLIINYLEQGREHKVCNRERGALLHRRTASGAKNNKTNFTENPVPRSSSATRYPTPRNGLLRKLCTWLIWGFPSRSVERRRWAAFLAPPAHHLLSLNTSAVVTECNRFVVLFLFFVDILE